MRIYVNPRLGEKKQDKRFPLNNVKESGWDYIIPYILL